VNWLIYIYHRSLPGKFFFIHDAWLLLQQHNMLRY
jgi:hypothetical protein